MALTIRFKKKKLKRFLIFAGLAIVLAIIIFAAMQYIKNRPRPVQQDSLAELMALPYITHSEEVADMNLTGVTVYNKEKSFEGYNFYTGQMIDMEGDFVRNWTALYLGIILDDGYYIGQKELPDPLIGRYTFDDEPIWEKDVLAHHEIIRGPNGNWFTFGRDVVTYQGRKVEFDTIMEFDMDGNFVSEWSTWDNFDYLHGFHDKLELDKPSKYIIPKEHRMNESLWGGDYDYYHLNTLRFVPPNDKEGLHAAFTPGNWILTMRHGSLIFILDKDTKEVLWYWGWKDVQGPHGSMMISNGNLLVFDNGRYRNWSRVIEVNPATLEIEWEYKADGFYTLTRGFIQELPNGNLLITETDDGHVFEITRDKEIVWEFWNPNFNNESKREVIYRMTRYPKDMIDGFMEE
jgi:hypothetical protein